MAKNSIDFDEIKDLVLAFAKEHPGWTAIGAGIGCGLGCALPKLAPTIENCWKYSVDRLVECLPKATTPVTLVEEIVVDGCETDQLDESNAA